MIFRQNALLIHMASFICRICMRGRTVKAFAKQSCGLGSERAAIGSRKFDPGYFNKHPALIKNPPDDAEDFNNEIS